MMTITTEIKNSIISEMAEELSEREYSFEERHLDKIVTEWFTQKRNLINVLSNHPNWNPEKFMIQFDADMERRICTDEVHRFTYWLSHHVNGVYDFRLNDQTREYKICDFINHISTQFFNETMETRINEINALNDNFKLRTNMKSSKAIGKICREEGWDKLEGFNQKYAALCDCLNPLKVKRHTCISVNPLDFLLMSNGNSWESCHYIGQAYDCGCYSSGTISYMLDEHSFIFYTVDASYDGNQIEREPKINRQVFGYNDEVIAQLRLYPQSNDSGAENVYDDIRAIVQKVISDCLGKPNMWIKSKSDVKNVIEHGYGATCYPDWRGSNPGAEHCSISTLKERANGKEFRKITFGAEPICISCGCRHRYEDNISCCVSTSYEYCSDCGCRIHEDDVYWYGDRPYCSDCVTYCDRCYEYVPNDEAREIDGHYVCDHCIEWYDDYQECEHCGEIHHTDNMVCTYNGDYYCDDCADEYVERCEECGEHYHRDDMHYDDETGNVYCDDCYEDILEERKEDEELETA